LSGLMSLADGLVVRRLARTFEMRSDRSHAPRGNAAMDALRLLWDAERPGLHSHAERGNDQWREWSDPAREVRRTR